ncbi:MAG: hypothetical protein M3Q07_24555 [Pseudobdellovibrionaceae bacterium]|nr:hypothetical protein [Pseudobdellovibrionaceae bacterium]
MTRSLWVSFLAFLSHLCAPLLYAQDPTVYATSSASEPVEVQSELGVLGVINHRIRQSRDHTHFDYGDEGGQDNLVTFHRHTAEMKMDDGNRLRFVYQPLELRSRTALKRDILVDRWRNPGERSRRWSRAAPGSRHELPLDPEVRPGIRSRRQSCFVGHL